MSLDTHGSVTQSMSSIHRQFGQRVLDLVAFKEDGFRRLSAFSRDSRHLLSRAPTLRESLADVFEKGAERCQSLVAGLRRVASALFERVQKSGHDIGIEIIESKLGSLFRSAFATCSSNSRIASA